MTAVAAERAAVPSRAGRALVLRLGPLSLRWRVRTLVVGAGLVLAMLALLVVAVSVGARSVAPGEVVLALLGVDTGGSSFIVRELRLPRALCAVGVGAALGMSGALFQTVVRNPLGSPELIGFTQGASAGAVAGIVLAGATGAALAGSALAGGFVAAVVVYLGAFRRGLLGTRLVLVGIGVGAMLNAVTWWLLTRAELTQAQVASAWLVGSLNARSWDHVWLVVVVLAVLAPACLAVAPWLRMIDLGEDAASALGVPVRRAQLVLVVLGVALCALGVAVAGPVPFIALVAPQVSRRLVRGTGLALAPSALTGALLLLAADVVAQHALPVAMPVGVATGVVGGVYLAWVLSREGRRR
ncbi:MULTISPECIES: iron chelate uptake ABC transporter family permease subunit [unclassified Actinotalea]|uniref:FecCD family ABC transporter permease n=1 Tax=unclassified Actinotalea TaxID=2638618 RepID=UPI0021073F39|nr:MULTISPECIES: iron chelate uptake ABC transporter family permease subunit [unclassified Actinotalea]